MSGRFAFRPRSILLAALALPLASCVGLKLTPVRSTHALPSNVAVYFRVETLGGDPVGGLSADAFRIYEDDGLVSQFESKQTILNPEVASSHYTLLLVDMSGSVSASGSTDALVEAVLAFADRIEKQQKVAVYAFDGAAELHPIATFGSAGGARAAAKALATFTPTDPSTNLNGAVVKGLAELDRALKSAEHPMRFGSLVVFSDGSDRARRVSDADARQAIVDSKYDVFAIGLGAEMKDATLRAFGKDGSAHADDKSAVARAFDSIAARIESRKKSFYLLSYCSPARAGKHEVRIEASFKDQGARNLTGSLTRHFDATGFAPGCDPNQKPPFDVTRGDAVAIKPSDEKKGGAAKPAAPPPAKPPTAPTAKPEGETFMP